MKSTEVEFWESCDCAGKTPWDFQEHFSRVMDEREQFAGLLRGAGTVANLAKATKQRRAEGQND